MTIIDDLRCRAATIIVARTQCAGASFRQIKRSKGVGLLIMAKGVLDQ